jgi:hypothetical protein
MKPCFLLFSLLTAFASFAQKSKDWNAIDAAVLHTTASTPDSLAQQLTAGYTDEAQKVRALYSWITQKVSYNTALYSPSKRSSKKEWDPTDTMTVWKSGDEMTAIRVMHRRFAVCEGYARLFKVLCDYAGIEAKVIYGYARTNVGSRRFRTNHTWNAVRIDSTWHLLDATWAAGYFNYRDEFVQERNDFYYLTPPQDFIHDHYPEDLRWALLTEVPTYHEQNKAPFYYKAFDKYKLQPATQQTGVLSVQVDDTLTLTWQTPDAGRDKTIAPSAFFDSTMLTETPRSLFLSPSIEGNKLLYRFTAAADIHWVHLLYNGDVVARYRIEHKEPEQTAMKNHF